MTKDRQAAMQKGRERAAKARRKAAISRVAAFRRWLAADVEATKARRHAEAMGEPLPRRPAMPAIPSSYDFEVADEG